jgi:16S rRNA (uracil1498-N3)-methyltransferase
MSERFYSAVPITTERATLDGAEAHHLLHVMRAAIGEPVTLFDNSGSEFPAIIEKLGRSSVDLRVIERIEINRELPFSLTVGVALPKGDRQKWLVEKLTELGVTTLVPLNTTRGVAQPTDSARERLLRSVIEASKQCGRNRLMQIAAPQNWDQWITNLPYPSTLEERIANAPNLLSGAIRSPVARLLADPSGTPLFTLQIRPTQATQLAIGPEGGLANEELIAARLDGWQIVSLGPRILRVETAAIALTATIALR